MGTEWSTAFLPTVVAGLAGIFAVSIAIEAVLAVVREAVRSGE